MKALINKCSHFSCVTNCQQLPWSNNITLSNQPPFNFHYSKHGVCNSTRSLKLFLIVMRIEKKITWRRSWTTWAAWISNRAESGWRRTDWSLIVLVRTCRRYDLTRFFEIDQITTKYILSSIFVFKNLYKFILKYLKKGQNKVYK